MKNLRERLHGILAVDLSQADTFEAYSQLLSIFYLRVTFVAYIGGALLFWPTDAYLLPERAQDVLAISRPLTSAVGGVCLALTWALERHPRFAIVGVTVCGSFMMMLLGGFMGQCGGVGDIYFHFVYLLPFFAVLFVVPLWKRVFITCITTCVYPVGFLIGNPTELNHPNLGSSLAYLSFGAMIGITIGHLIYQLTRQNFQQREVLELRIAERTKVLAKLASYLEQSREQERRRVSRELHDEAAQLLTGMRIELQMLKDRVVTEPALKPALSRLEHLIDESFTMHRAIIRSLRPRILEEAGLVVAVAQHIERLEGKKDLEVVSDLAPDLPALPEDTALTAFRAIQELITNALRHAEATKLEVRVASEGGELIVEVADDGQGFNAEAGAGGFGLLGMRERVRALGGNMRIESAGGSGTRARVELPLIDAGLKVVGAD